MGLYGVASKGFVRRISKLPPGFVRSSLSSCCGRVPDLPIGLKAIVIDCGILAYRNDGSRISCSYKDKQM
jgi:hypothetical protein